MPDNKVIDTFMKTVLDSYTQTALKRVDTENIRNTSAAHGMTSGYNDKDKAALSSSYGSIIPDAGAMQDAITQGNLLLTLTKQISSISKSAGTSEEEALKIRSKISTDMAIHAEKQLELTTKQSELVGLVSEKYKKQLQNMESLIAQNKELLENG